MSHLPSSPVKIFVLGNGSLLDEGISNMLTLYSHLSVTRILYTDDSALYDLVKFEHPYAVFINEFDALDIAHAIELIFSVPSTYIRCVIVARVEKSRFDVYDRPATYTPTAAYRKNSVAVNTKEELIDLVVKVSC